MNFIDPEARRRHAYVDEAIRVGGVLVNHEVVGSALSADFVESYNQMAEHYFVPNIHHGVIELTPEQQKSDGHAIVAVELDERIVRGPSLAHFNPLQRSRVMAQAFEMGAVDEPDAEAFVDYIETDFREMAAKAEPLTSLKENGALARVTSFNAWKCDTVNDRILSFTGRDVMLLGLPPGGNGMIYGKFVAHEHVHQMQKQDPVTVAEISDLEISTAAVEMEKDAYQVQTDIVMGQQKVGYTLNASDKVASEAVGIIPHLVADAVSWKTNARDLLDHWMHARNQELLRTA
jgi:hypothetical protein